MRLSQKAELRRQFDTYRESFRVGNLLTLAAFTSMSLLDSVAEEFGDHVMFTFIRVRGVCEPSAQKGCSCAAFLCRLSLSFAFEASTSSTAA